MAIKTGSITSSFSKTCSERTSVYNEHFDIYDKACSKRKYPGSGFLYGYDFRALSNYNNVIITDVKATVTGNKYGTSSSYTYDSSLLPITDFEITGSNSSANKNYTSISSDSTSFTSYLNTTTKSKYTLSVNGLVTWANSNLDKFIGGYNSNSFGIRYYIVYGYIYDIALTVDYTYEEIDYVTVTTAVSPAGAGTVTPTHQVEEGSTATVAAIPNAGYKFSHWLINGADSGVTSTTLSGTVDSNITVTAVFVLDKINKIVCDTSKQPTILIDTQVVKAILIDTTKVYG